MRQLLFGAVQIKLNKQATIHTPLPINLPTSEVDGWLNRFVQSDLSRFDCTDKFIYRNLYSTISMK